MLLSLAALCVSVLPALGGPPEIAIDGSCDEWPRGVVAAADAEFVYFQLPFGELRSLLTAEKPVVISVDMDDDASTGDVRGGLGIDFEISLRHRDSWREPSFFATWYGDGQPEPIALERIEPVMLPTSAAESFEIRLRRDAHAGLMRAGLARGVLRMENAKTIREGRESRTESVDVSFSLRFPAGEPVGLVSAALPVKPAGAVRVVSHNVLWSSPEKTPDAFGRMYRALDPDVYLIQEWGRGPWSVAYEDELEAWFRAHVDAERTWTAIRCKGWGVAVVTHHPVLERGPTLLLAETLTAWDFPVRFAGAVVRAPGAVLTVGSVHLKAGGDLGSPEDQRRFDEAREIRGVMGLLSADASRMAGDLPSAMILGGDFNHNGHPLVPATALKGLDRDGSALSFVRTPVLGTDSRYSFGGPAYGHRRIFLDYIAIGEAGARAANGFVLDTEILDDASLDAMGLERGDSSAADHLPVVVDLLIGG